MTNENKRERLLENAKTWLHENCPTRLIKDYDAGRLADFAAQEVEDAVRAERVRVADELAMKHAETYCETAERGKGPCAMCDYIDELRGSPELIEEKTK